MTYQDHIWLKVYDVIFKTLHWKKKFIDFYGTSSGLANMKDSLIKIKIALTVWCAQLFTENMLPSSVKFQLETIRYVYFAPVVSNVGIAQFESFNTIRLILSL